MPRQARVVAVDVPHHITHRGNNRREAHWTRFVRPLMRLTSLSISSVFLRLPDVSVPDVPDVLDKYLSWMPLQSFSQIR